MTPARAMPADARGQHRTGRTTDAQHPILGQQHSGRLQRQRRANAPAQHRDAQLTRVEVELGGQCRICTVHTAQMTPARANVTVIPVRARTIGVCETAVMTGPTVERPEVPRTGDERTLLDAWLDYHRATLLMKCAGLTDEQLRMRSAEPSTLSLVGLVRHMADVERGWFRRGVGNEEAGPINYSDDDPDGDFDKIDTADVAHDLAVYQQEIERARQATAKAELDDTFGDDDPRGPISVRWVYLHMIEEYARHNGHADLLRERIDGVTGD
jgi:uncharacterized damage-inducible protein DinB